LCPYIDLLKLQGNITIAGLSHALELAIPQNITASRPVILTHIPWFGLAVAERSHSWLFKLRRRSGSRPVQFEVDAVSYVFSPIFHGLVPPLLREATAGFQAEERVWLASRGARGRCSLLCVDLLAPSCRRIPVTSCVPRPAKGS